MINLESNNKNKIVFIVIVIIIITTLFIIYLLLNKENSNEIDLSEVVLEENLIEEKINNSIENEAKISEKNEVENKIEKEVNEIVVHITGEVKKEGIVYLKEGDRVIDAIKEAGGETKNADLSKVNLAYELSDGQKIYIPNKGEKLDNFIIDEGGSASMSENDNKQTKININTADEVELDNLPGIGPSIAKKIVDYRNENGKFNNIEDIKNVSGIGDSKYEDIKDNITV